MIKINKYIYIHFTTILLFVICFFNRKLEILAISYMVIFLHELSHLIAALLIGLKPAHIVFFPFGVNLKLKNSIVYSIADEIILYISGPLSNIIMAFFLIKLKNNGELWNLFYYNNICHFIFNMLPILPMDGAVVLKKIITRGVGAKKACNILKLLSFVLISLLVSGEIYLLINGQFNYTMLFTLIFLTANIFTNTEKYHIDFVKELMFYKIKDNFDYKKVKTYMIKENGDYRRLAETFAQGNYYVIFKENKEGHISEILSERDIIEKILE